MANPTYGTYSIRKKDDPGLFRSIVKVGTTAVITGLIAYAGATAKFDQKLDAWLNGEREAAAGFAPVELERRVNAQGRAEFYAVHISKDGKRNEQPIVQGIIGPQIGSAEYAIQNTDYGRISVPQAAQVHNLLADKLNGQQRLEALLRNTDFRQLPPEQREKYGAIVWEALEPGQKYVLIMKELEKALKK